MVISSHKFKKFSVYDENGQKLGQITDFVLDANTLIIEQIIVRSSPSLKSLSPELIINRKQIVSVESNKIIVKSTGIENTSLLHPNYA